MDTEGIWMVWFLVGCCLLTTFAPVLLTALAWFQSRQEKVEENGEHMP